MRIAMLTNNYKPFVGGVPISVERLAKGLKNLGQEVYIFAPSYEEEVEEEYVIRYGSRKRKLPAWLPKIILFVNQRSRRLRKSMEKGGKGYFAQYPDWSRKKILTFF